MEVERYKLIYKTKNDEILIYEVNLINKKYIKK